MDWKGNCYKSTKDSFIFSFTDKKNLQTAKVSYPANNMYQFSVYCNSSCGPAFGRDVDLCFNYNNNWYDNYGNPNCSYPEIDDIQCGYPDPFEVDDYEVFQVVRM